MSVPVAVLVARLQHELLSLRYALIDEGDYGAFMDTRLNDLDALAEQIREAL